MEIEITHICFYIAFFYILAVIKLDFVYGFIQIQMKIKLQKTHISCLTYVVEDFKTNHG